ncbi:hypothetical protein NIES267_24440 [Calothrix parasitica NIES-267]|uniref:Pentapeptide repeat-containing protein n=1 Tax=Calothrix parasitica NIES-267 TaxID=1973488 RepID=A0A1Z4LPE5_9CYAN|nr:hypothetical protein NIES267_24440 [Calothrix parasitica NIES-267]
MGISDSTFKNADFTRCDFLSIRDADFTNCDLSGSEFPAQDCIRCEKANFSQANLTNTNLYSSIDLTEVIIDGNNSEKYLY